MRASLQRILEDEGAQLATVLGTVLPGRFAAADREYGAARDGCAMWIAGFRRMLAAVGEDRVTFLHGMLSNDVKALSTGEGTDAALLTQQGKIVSDLRVYAERDRILLDVFAERADVVTAALEKFIVADDVELSVPDDAQPLIGITGPGAGAVLEAVLGGALPARRAVAHETRTVAGATLRVMAVDESNGAGYMLCGAPSRVTELWQALRAAGAQPIGMEALNVLRVEAGIPWYGIDMDEDVLLMETNLDRAVSFSKGCYLGQEVVERVAARGKVNKKLTGLTVDGDTVPLHDATLAADGRDIGRITSAVRSPALQRVIALGYVHRDYLDPGTIVSVVAPSAELKARVTTLPFPRAIP